MRFLAHTKDGKTFTNEDDCQPLQEHLERTARFAKARADVFGAGEAAEAIGLLHDIGKYSKAFQDRIRGKNVTAPHSLSGAYILDKVYSGDSKYYGIVVASHHTGLCDWGTDADNHSLTYRGKLHCHKQPSLPYEGEITLPESIAPISIKPQKEALAFQLATYLKMLFSVLVDSDFTDTEESCSGISRKRRYPNVSDLFDRLMENIPSGEGSINQIRNEILADCLLASEKQQGLYSLCAPTGAGKTLSSLAFALKHAKTHELRRVIYVVPYTSIIEQNADVVGQVLGNENVLEHHSNIDIDSEDFKARWSSEDWGIPVIFTTNVQFFESLFSNKTKSIRKLHNIAKSVVIFDEAQMLPVDYLTPCMAIVSELITNYGVTAVLCSATQPLVQKYAYKGIANTEIISNPESLSERLKRVTFHYTGKRNDEKIVSELKARKSALVVVNSRKHAYFLYDLMKSEVSEGLFYLSTLLTPSDRSRKIAEIKKRLICDLPTIVISTQLIEAGVDVDFPVVYRSIAGIDSIIQAGGRANREGKLPQLGEVIVFEPCCDGAIPKSIETAAKIGKEVVDTMGDRAFGLSGIRKYFELLYVHLERDNVMDKKGIMSEFFAGRRGGVKMNFEKAARNFKLIDNQTYSVIIMCDESKGLVNALQRGEYTRDTIRKLQKYSVSVYSSELKQLREDNALEEISEGVNLLVTEGYYSPENGLDIFTDDNKNAEAIFC